MRSRRGGRDKRGRGWMGRPWWGVERPAAPIVAVRWGHKRERTGDGEVDANAEEEESSILHPDSQKSAYIDFPGQIQQGTDSFRMRV